MIDLYLFRSALRDLLRPKRLFITGLLILVPAALAMILRLKLHDYSTRAMSIYNTLAPLLVFGFILVIPAVVYATGVISSEVEQKTIVFLLTRPVSRWRILLAKFAAAALVVTLTSWAALTLLAVVVLGPARLSGSPLAHDLLIAPIGALAYGSLFLLLATLISRPLLWGLLYVFGIESWTSYVPGIQKISIMYYLRVIAPHAQIERESMDIREMMSMLTPTTVTTTTAWTFLAVTIVLCLLASLFIFSVNEYVPREDAE